MITALALHPSCDGAAQFGEQTMVSYIGMKKRSEHERYVAVCFLTIYETSARTSTTTTAVHDLTSLSKDFFALQAKHNTGKKILQPVFFVLFFELFRSIF